MAHEKVREFFRTRQMEDRVREFEVSSATVQLAAQALNCEPKQIAKTISCYVDSKPILIVMAGHVKIDNARFKNHFQQKAKMIPFEEVEAAIGHQVGGVCPFGIHEGVEVYLDESLKENEIVYPAAGSSNSCVILSIPELEKCFDEPKWIYVSKYIE